MSAKRDVVSTVWCDGPLTHRDGCPGQDQDAMTIPEHRQYLRREGWTTRRIDGRLRDFCPACSRAGECRGAKE